MKDWHKLKPDLFKKQPYHLPGCDTYPRSVKSNCSTKLTMILMSTFFIDIRSISEIVMPSKMNERANWPDSDLPFAMCCQTSFTPDTLLKRYIGFSRFARRWRFRCGQRPSQPLGFLHEEPPHEALRQTFESSRESVSTGDLSSASRWRTSAKRAFGMP